MKIKWLLVGTGLCLALGLAGYLCLFDRFVERESMASAPHRGSVEDSGLDAGLQLTQGRVPAEGPLVPVQPLPTDDVVNGLHNPPRTPEELRAWVAWMKSLSRDDLLRITNAEFDFKQSDLVRMLKDLKGDWVVGALSRLAIDEPDDLVKATLVVGLCGCGAMERMAESGYLNAIKDLLPQYTQGARDPFHVGSQVVFGAYSASLVQKQDLIEILKPALEASDNPDILIHGFSYLGGTAGAEAMLTNALREHPSPDARFGALEGLRDAALDGRIPADELTQIGVEALKVESSERNKILLLEMVAAGGAASGLDALADFVRNPESGLLASSAALLAVKGDPNQSRELFERALKNDTLSDKDRQALYGALGALPDEAGGQYLLGVVRDEQLPEAERLRGLQGLWNRPMDEALAQELSDIVSGDAPGAMRAESLRMLAFGGESFTSIDARGLAVEDPDPEVRKEAVVLAAMSGGDDARGWLEERLLNDRSPDVKAAALGSMVMQAHYTGDGDAVLNHLASVRKLTDDQAVLQMVQRGEEMVRNYDPRRMELQLAEDARYYADVVQYTSGPSQRAMRRQADYLNRILTGLSSASAK